MMLGLWILLGGVLVVGGLVAGHARSVRRRREALRGRRLSADDADRLARVFPLWNRVPDEIRAEAEGWIHVFLAEKNFESCGGLPELTREMRLAIAGPACLLIARRPQDYYARLRSILVYPGAFEVRDDHGVGAVHLGESWQTGSVVLSWQSILQGDRNPEDGLNVVLHEFAHQLDQEDGAGDGVPEFEDPRDYGRWSRAFAPAFEHFRSQVAAGRRTVMDPYGAENPAEFFAVATETFFERATAMKARENGIYVELARFYGMDPAAW